jgi:hypothetical protein
LSTEKLRQKRPYNLERAENFSGCGQLRWLLVNEALSSDFLDCRFHPVAIVNPTVIPAKFKLRAIPGQMRF